MQDIMQKNKTKPVHEVRIGAIKAAIWANETEAGIIRHNVTFARLYKGEQNECVSSESFGRDDLLLLGKVADQAHTWIVEQNHPKEPEKAA